MSEKNVPGIVGQSGSLTATRMCMKTQFKRRDVLWILAAAGGFAPGLSMASSTSGSVGIAVLDHGGGARSRPRSVEQLMWEVSKRTSIRVRESVQFVSLESDTLFENPFLVWIGQSECPPFSSDARRRLSHFLRAGGSLLISDASPPGDDAFDRCVRREMSAIWSDRDWLRLGNDHTVFRTFYLLRKPEGRIRRSAYFEGVMFDDRSPVIYERNDLFGAFGREKMGGWSLPVNPGGNRQREMAFRTGINLMMYATCLNYKRDQVHVLDILRRRRWKVEQSRPIR